jgi:hypothetical protein
MAEVSGKGVQRENVTGSGENRPLVSSDSLARRETKLKRLSSASNSEPAIDRGWLGVSPAPLIIG